MKRIFLLIFISSLICVFPVGSLIRGQTVSGSTCQVRVLFSPQDNCAREIVSQIDKAKNYVYAAVYYFTSRPIAYALIKARDRGVDVKVCLDKEQPTYEYSKSRFLQNQGINIRLIGDSGIMHNKFCVIDDHITITGSYNWTVRADLENDENLLVIESQEIAKTYKEQFNKFWSGTHVDTCVYKDKDRLVKRAVKVGSALSCDEYFDKDKPDEHPDKGKYVGHKNSKKFHYPECRWAKKMNKENQVWFNSQKEAIDKGYVPCKVCNP